VISLGPDAAGEQLRKALSMGADRAVLLKADKVPADGFAIAEALAAELKGGAYDVIFFGKKAIDSGAETVGPMVAELLDLPCVPGVFKLDIQGGKGTAMRALEGAVEVLEFPLPAGAHDRRGAQQGAPAVAQGDHGGQEEAARDPAGAARPGRRHGGAGWSCRPSAPPAASSARGRTRWRSW
jgi:hypothetical protein